MRDSTERTIRAQVQKLSTQTGLKPQRAFAVWYAIHSLRLEEQEAIDATSYDGGNDRGVDIFVVDDDLERVVIGQTKYLSGRKKFPTPADLSLLFDVLEELQDPQDLLDSGRDDLAEAADALREARERGYSIQLHAVYTGEKSSELERRVRQFNRKRLSENISAALFGLDDLRLIYADYYSSEGRVDHAVLPLIPGAYHEEKGHYGRSLTATLAATTLRDLFRMHGNRLFDQNVRLFLGARKGSVNAGIRDTINSTEERANFWAYNNGLTIVARDFKVDAKKNMVEVSDFSIVNGCQTTVSVAESPETALAEVSVLARFVAARPDLVPKIIRFTNSQTPINIWDLSARDKVQQRIKSELAEMESPWFYALRRGEFEGLADKKRFGPSGDRRVLPFPLSSQYLAAFRGLPVEAYKDKARLFTSYRDQVFPKDIGARDLLWAWYSGLAVEWAIQEFRREVKPDPFIQRVLKRGARFFISAVIGQLLRARNGDDFVAKLDPRRLSDKAMQERLSRYARISVAYYVGIIRDLEEGGADLGVLLRNSETAEKIRQRVQSRIFEEKTAPKALEEKLPRLPGITKR